MIRHRVSVKINEDEYRHFTVPKPVKTYIQQLENAVRFPHTKEKLINLYPDRFGLQGTKITHVIFDEFVDFT